jgi:DNA polymerase III epsilon subunit family exonuclease
MKTPVLCVLDLETTGLSAQNDEVIEAGLILVGARMEEIETISFLARPTRPISSMITRITGIDNAMVQHAEPFDLQLPKLIEAMKDVPVLGYNVSFDTGFIRASASRTGLKIRMKQFCVLKLARTVMPELPNHKLGTLVRHLNLETPANHRALDDARATLAVFRRLRAISQ